MHNNQTYLEILMRLAKKEGILNANIISEKNIGSRLIGSSLNFIYSTGKILNTYNKAFVAATKGESETEQFLNLVNKNLLLEKLTINDKGFICTLPFHYIKSIEMETTKTKEGDKKMQIAKFLTKENILLDIKSNTKNDVIKEIAYTLKKSDKLSDYDKFIKDIFERERLSTTGIGNSVAIPHARTDAVDNFIIAFGRSKKGVDFNSIDKKPAQFIAVMGTPKSKGLNEYLQILAHLTRLLNKDSFQKELLMAENEETVLNLFKR